MALHLQPAERLRVPPGPSSPLGPYVAWLKKAGWELAIQRPPRLDGPVEISIAAGRPDRRRRDLDNVMGKAVLDLLTQHQVITDDSEVIKLSATWGSTVPAGRLHVAVAGA